ncbi:MAG: acetamidase, partial [Psychrobacter alimentarius]
MLKKTALSLFVLSTLTLSLAHAQDFQVLKEITNKPTQLKQGPYKGNYYVPSTLQTISWGYLPNRDAKPVLSVPSGSTVTFDTVSHEGLLEDQGRDAEKYFQSKGVTADYVLDEAKKITGSDLAHDFHKDGPHIVTGPLEIRGAMPGDILKVEVIKIEPRVPYGVISNRHGKGTLVGEFPK